MILLWNFNLIMFYTYILESEKSGELYIGFTTDLKERLIEHNRGLNLSTKKNRPWKVIYCEICTNKTDAMRREKYFKTTQGKRMIHKRLQAYFAVKWSKDLMN
jgi:putative endonuclease